MRLSYYTAIAISCITLTVHSAIQATKDYCDRNAEKAVTNALNSVSIALPTIVGPAVDEYMSENGIPTITTNTIIETYHENIISNYYNNFITNNLYTNTYITNNIHTIESSITNNIYTAEYITTNLYTIETVTNEFITTLEKETNTLFTVDMTGILSITKNGELIWKQMTIASNETTNTFVPIYPKIRNGAIVWEINK